jgi:hypothetical protein
MTPLDIHLFWAWFRAREAMILAAVRESDHEWLRRELSTRVSKLTPAAVHPRLNWEIGPGQRKPFQFVLSPVVKSNMKYAEEAIRLALDLESWEWHSFKPYKSANQYDLDRGRSGSI